MDIEVAEHGSGPDLVVFVHGVLDRGRSFDRVVGLLSSQCRCLTYDRRGYGGSTGTGEPVGVDVHIGDLVDIIDGRRVTVVGHSFGGVTALGAALQLPEQIEAVVLYETGMAWLPTWEDKVLGPLLWSEDPVGDGARLMFGDRLDSMPDERRAARLVEARAFVAEERSVRTGEPPYDVAELRAPMVYGRSDTYPLTSVPDHLMAVLPSCEIVEVPGAGHNAHRTAPEAFADLVRRGLALRR